jgi:hypothetical protein
VLLQPALYVLRVDRRPEARGAAAKYLLRLMGLFFRGAAAEGAGAQGEGGLPVGSGARLGVASTVLSKVIAPAVALVTKADVGDAARSGKGAGRAAVRESGGAAPIASAAEALLLCCGAAADAARALLAAWRDGGALLAHQQDGSDLGQTWRADAAVFAEEAFGVVDALVAANDSAARNSGSGGAKARSCSTLAESLAHCAALLAAAARDDKRSDCVRDDPAEPAEVGTAAAEQLLIEGWLPRWLPAWDALTAAAPAGAGQNHEDGAAAQRDPGQLVLQALAAMCGCLQASGPLFVHVAAARALNAWCDGTC